MADSSNGERFTFSVSQVHPRLHDYDQAWHASGTAMLTLLEDGCFFLFFRWFMLGKWPSLTEATVSYPTPIVAGDAPLKIDGWLVSTNATDFDVTLAYEVRSEASPTSDPVYTAELRWVGRAFTPPGVDMAKLAVSNQLRSSSGRL